MNRFEKKLLENGYKITRARAELISFFSKKHQLVSAQKIAKKIPAIDRASVYRALNIFEKLGLLNIDIIGKEKMYCSSENPHHHIICRKCGYVEIIKCTHNFKSKNFTNIRHQLTLSGLCSKCS